MMIPIAHHIGQRRSEAWWEPTFKPELTDSLIVSDWNFQNSTGPKGAFLSATALDKISKIGESRKFVNLTFEDCDIQGNFDHSPTTFFDKCRFQGCDFAHSNWKRATFRDCEFTNCSFALASFEDSEFRECRWSKIGLQGSKTSFVRTYITNPNALIGAGFSGTDKSNPHPIYHKLYQWARLEGTKAHLARNILYSHEVVGDDGTYYQTARLHDIQQMRAKIANDILNLSFGETIFKRISGLFIAPHIAELIMLLILGASNGWGATILRPMLSLIISFYIFGEIYHNYYEKECIGMYWQKSFDITTIAGYTNQVKPEQPMALRIIEGLQLAISIIFYTIFFSTLVARNSRSR